jgi:hypothetical protein
MVVKQLIVGGNHVKGAHLNPELRKPSKKQGPELRKVQVPELHKAQVPELRKVQVPELSKKHGEDQTGWNCRCRTQSDAELQQEVQLRFKALGGEGIVSPQKAILLCRNTTRFFSKDTTRRE